MSAESEESLGGWLPPGVRFEGDHRFEGAVRIEGVFVGAVTGSDWVHIAEGGQVIGSVTAPQVLVDGHVQGQITASERVTLRRKSVIEGELSTPWLDARPGHQIRATLTVWRQRA